MVSPLSGAWRRRKSNATPAVRHAGACCGRPMVREMKMLPTKLSGVVVAETVPVIDPGGAFARLFCERELSEVMGGRHIVQINHSRTVTLGAVRGLHFQRPPQAEMKLVRCLKGRVWDVTVDVDSG